MAIQIEHQVNLQQHNTFKVKATARYFTKVTSTEDIRELIDNPVFKENKHLLLGGGSNILFLQNFDGLVIKSEEKSVTIIHETDEEVFIRVASGMVWHELVLHCLSSNWGGLENLSLIPGTVGAAPIQNIGAYGVEISDILLEVNGIDLKTGQPRTFSNHECKFAYRESIFKHDLKNSFFISSVTLRLTKKNHKTNWKYAALKNHFDESGTTSPTITEISRAVIEIRQSKLPDPAILGNAGSFFKNPIITENQANTIKNKWPTAPLYPFVNQLFKIPAGWLIESCGWKGKRIGAVGVHDQQALVIINYDNAQGEDIFQLSKKIWVDVKEKFDIELIREVNTV